MLGVYLRKPRSPGKETIRRLSRTYHKEQITNIHLLTRRHVGTNDLVLAIRFVQVGIDRVEVSDTHRRENLEGF